MRDFGSNAPIGSKAKIGAKAKLGSKAWGAEEDGAVIYNGVVIMEYNADQGAYGGLFGAMFPDENFLMELTLNGRTLTAPFVYGTAQFYDSGDPVVFVQALDEETGLVAGIEGYAQEGENTVRIVNAGPYFYEEPDEPDDIPAS